MGKMKETTIDAGEEVVKAIGELGATTDQVANVAELASEIDHEEAKNWLTTIFKALIAAFK